VPNSALNVGDSMPGKIITLRNYEADSHFCTPTEINLQALRVPKQKSS
jgi:hypothetical protein